MKMIKAITILFAMFVIANTGLNAQSSSNATKKEATVSTIKTVDLEVEGMSCQKGCADGIDKKFKTVSGILKSKTKLDTGISSITYDESKIRVPELISIIEKRGYTAKVSTKNKKV